MRNLKKLFLILISSLVLTYLAYIADFWWEGAYEKVKDFVLELYNNVDYRKNKFHLIYALVIGVIITSICYIFNVWALLKYQWNKRELNLGHSQDTEKFSTKIQKLLIGNPNNKYLVKCFDSLYKAVVSGNGFIYKENLQLKCSLIDAIDRIPNGLRIEKEMYLFFLEKTVELIPNHVIGVWDIETNPIPRLEDISDDPIFAQYEKMYRAIKKDNKELIRIFIYPKEVTLNKAINKTLEFSQYFEKHWGVNKFYYVPKVNANANNIFDGIIIDDKFYLSYQERTDEVTKNKIHQVTFKNWNHNSNDKAELLKLLGQCTCKNDTLINSKKVIYTYPTF